MASLENAIGQALADWLGISDLRRQFPLLKEFMVANFDRLNASLDAHNTALAEAVARVDEDVQSLKDEIARLNLDTEDQARLDAATDRLDEATSRLRSVDPVQPETEEPTEQ